MSGRIILLKGASSAGKSTLAAAIQNAADVPLLRMSLDFFFFGKVLPRLGENGFNWADMRPKVLAGYDGCLPPLLAPAPTSLLTISSNQPPFIRRQCRHWLALTFSSWAFIAQLKSWNGEKGSAATANSARPAATSKASTHSALTTSRSTALIHPNTTQLSFSKLGTRKAWHHSEAKTPLSAKTRQNLAQKKHVVIPAFPTLNSGHSAENEVSLRDASVRSRHSPPHVPLIPWPFCHIYSG